MQSRLLQPKRRPEMPHLRINLAHRAQLTSIDSIDTVDQRPTKQDCPPLDSTTLSGLEHRLYMKFQDSVRTERLRECDPLAELEQQNQRLDELVNTTLESLVQASENNPEFERLNCKLTALDRTCVRKRPPRVPNKLDRRIQGQANPIQTLPKQLTAELSASLALLPCRQKIEQLIHCHNELLRVAGQLLDANTELVTRSNIQKVKLAQRTQQVKGVTEETSELRERINDLNVKHRLFERSREEMLQKERAKWEIELQEEERLLEKLSML